MSITVKEFRELLTYDKFDLVKIHPGMVEMPLLWAYSTNQMKVPRTRRVGKCIFRESDGYSIDINTIYSLLEDDSVGEIKYEFKNDFIQFLINYFSEVYPKMDITLSELLFNYADPPSDTIFSISLNVDELPEHKLKSICKRFPFYRFYEHEMFSEENFLEIYFTENMPSQIINYFKLCVPKQLNCELILYQDYLTLSNLNNTKEVWLKGIDAISSIFPMILEASVD